MAKGDIVLVNFPFTDLSGSKLRPAVVLIDAGSDATLCFITSRFHWQEETDLRLTPGTRNGLKQVSLVRTGKIATLDKAMIRGQIGELSAFEIAQLNEKLKILLRLT